MTQDHLGTSVPSEEVEEVDVADLLQLSKEDAGVHLRLLAGVESMAQRSTHPEVIDAWIGESGWGHSDHDIMVSLEPGDPGELTGRSVEGHIDVPLHVTVGGNVYAGGLYDELGVDLTVHSNSVENTATRFTGSVPRSYRPWHETTSTMVGYILWMKGGIAAERAAMLLLASMVWEFSTPGNTDDAEDGTKASD